MKKLLFFASAVALLASCSKDMTEDLAPAQVSGKSKIVASYETNGDAETRTHIEYETAIKGYSYFWDSADAVGVFDAEVENDVTNATFKNTVEGKKGVFDGDFDMFDGDKYIVYYPYNPNAKIEDGALTLSINANQNYNHKAAGEVNDIYAEGSFAQNAAPAVAYGTAKDGVLDAQFKAVASYIAVPVKGFGTVKKISLKIKDTDYVPVAGNLTVKVEDILKAEEGTVPAATLDTQNAAKEIVLNCGKGIDLSPETAVTFWFVVPANIDMRNKTMELYVNGEQTSTMTRTFAADFRKDTEGVTGANRVNWWGKTADEDFFYNPDGSFLINNQYDFLMYAYAATNGVAKMSDSDKEALAELGMLTKTTASTTTYTLNSAKIVKSPIDFEGFSGDMLFSDAEKYPDYLKTAMDAYRANGKAIESIGGENGEKYEIEGYVKGEDGKYGAAATISNLTVKGSAQNGIFARAQGKGSVVKNVTLKGMTVTTTEAPAIFLTSNPSNNFFGAFENVTVDGGEMKVEIEGATDVKGAILENVYLKNIATSSIKVKEYPTNTNYANLLFVDTTAELAAEYFTEDEVRFNEVRANDANGDIVTVADAAAAGKLIKAIDKAKSEANGFFSVVEREAPATEGAEGAVKTSFWTGLVPAAAPTGDVFTAEALAYAVVNRTEVVLTNDIDLMNGDWTPVVNSTTSPLYSSMSVKGAKSETANFTIKNVSIVADAETYVGNKKVAYLSLFGYEAKIEGLDVDGIKIDGSDLYEETVPESYVSGLAHTGSAKNVTVKNATIGAALTTAGAESESSFALRTKYAGVILGSVKGDNNLANCAAIDCNITAGENCVVGNVAGKVVLDCKKDTYTFDKIQAYNGVTGKNAFGKFVVTLPANSQMYLTINLTGFNAGVVPTEDGYTFEGNGSIAVRLIQDGYEYKTVFYKSAQN